MNNLEELLLFGKIDDFVHKITEKALEDHGERIKTMPGDEFRDFCYSYTSEAVSHNPELSSDGQAFSYILNAVKKRLLAERFAAGKYTI